MFEPKVCRKQMRCNEESTCDTVGTSRRPLVNQRLGNCAPLASLRYALDGTPFLNTTFSVARTILDIIDR